MKTIYTLLLLLAITQAIQVPGKSLNVTEIKDFTLGFLVGAGGAEKVQDGYPCINSVSEAQAPFQEIVAELESGEEAKMIEGIHKLFNLIQGLKPCREALVEGQQWFEQIENTFSNKANMIQGLMRLAQNKDVVLDDIRDFKSSWEADQMFMAGLKVGDVLKTFVWGVNTVETMSFLKFDPQPEDVKQVVFGILVGSHAVKETVSGQKCVSYLETGFNQIIEAFKQLSKFNFSKAIKALDVVFEIIHNSDKMKQCIVVENNGQSWWEAAAEKFTTPQGAAQGARNLAWYWFTTADDIGKAIWHFRHQDDYYKAGYELGQVMSIYVFGTPNPKESVPTTSFLRTQGVPAQFTECGLASPKIKVTSVTLGATPAKGVKDSITVVGTVSEHEEMKSVDINVTLGNAPLHKESLPKSDIYEAGDAYNFNYDVLVPGFAPSGAYEVSFTMKNDAGESIGCVDVKFNL